MSDNDLNEIRSLLEESERRQEERAVQHTERLQRQISSMRAALDRLTEAEFEICIPVIRRARSA